MKKILIILLLNATIACSLKAMDLQSRNSPGGANSPLNVKTCDPNYLPSDENLNAHLMDHQGWKELTRRALKQYPEHEDVKKLHRYLIIASEMVRKKLPKDGSVSYVEFVKKNRDVIMFGARENSYIKTGTIPNCPYPMYAIDERIWVNLHLPAIEEQIARDLSEKQKLPGHACLQ